MHSFSIEEEVEVLITARDSKAFGWWPARVKELRSNVAILCSSASAGELPGFNQVVHQDHLCPRSNMPHIQDKNFYSF
ncbi:Hypothetical protein FKW44_006284 [Caligus rogercresseyi]|uniref:Uncharacterized protein n=1 Tax=Caligus rogercresseyi TaxID=217165 RepID=A0A7T8KD46_CALRO|nr:Hypothetical protein FKW44_006284 [Caligus rogercresseyi]